MYKKITLSSLIFITFFISHSKIYALTSNEVTTVLSNKEVIDNTQEIKIEHPSSRKYQDGNTLGNNTMKDDVPTIMCGRKYSIGGNIKNTQSSLDGSIGKISIKKLDLNLLTDQFGFDLGSWIYSELSRAKVYNGTVKYIRTQSPCGDQIELTTSDITSYDFDYAKINIKAVNFSDAILDKNENISEKDVGMNYEQAVCLNYEQVYTQVDDHGLKTLTKDNVTHLLKTTNKNKLGTNYEYNCAGNYHVTVTVYTSDGKTKTSTFNKHVPVKAIKSKNELIQHKYKSALKISK